MTIDAKAAGFARAHGSFVLHFDATANYMDPDYAPWTLELDPLTACPDGCTGWGGFTAEEVIDFAAGELGEGPPEVQ